MAAEFIKDITADLNSGDGAIEDIGGWDYAVVQLVTPTGTINFETSNDSNAITGVSDGSAASATNFISCIGTSLTSGSGVTSLAASGLVKFSGIGRYLKIYGAGKTVTKGIIRLYKVF